MCFEVDSWAKRPAQTKAYKVMWLEGDGKVRSLNHYNVTWYENEVKELKSKAKTCFFDAFGIRHAQEGFYVYLRRKDAEAEAYSYISSVGTYGGNAIVLEVTVSPKDWLFSGLDTDARSVATYRRVKVPSKQGYLTWY